MESTDVVVVGAGFSGLAAARDLVAAGYSVVVCEAAARVGGRTDTLHLEGLTIELGGQWSGPGQHRLLALADHYGVATFPTPHDGVDLVVTADGVFPVDLVADDPSAGVIAALDALAEQVPHDAPWAAPAEWDEISMATWLEREVVDAAARQGVRQSLEGLMTTPIEDMSLLTVLHGGRTSGTLGAALGIEGGAQEVRFVGGVHQLAVRMAEDLGSQVVRLSTPVRLIESEEGAGPAIVHTEHGVIRARRVVVALAPSQLAPIAFTPAMPPARTALPELMAMGRVIKLQVVYPRPFWRERGYSGLIVADHGPTPFVVDNSDPRREEGVLATFLSAAHADEWGDARLGSDATAARGALFDGYVRRAFGGEAPSPVAVVDRDWVATPWVGGGYSGVMRPGGWKTVGPALARPVGPVHWASSETASMWTGYIEGALEAGERAAAEVVSALA